MGSYQGDDELNDDREKLFINAYTPSLSLIYEMYIIIFFIVPVSFLYGYYQDLRAANFRFTFGVLMLTFICSCLFLFLFGAAFLFRRIWPYKITTDDSGMYYSSFLRRVRVRWDQVESFNIAVYFIGRGIIDLRTRDETLLIPISMKESGKPYPKITLSSRWIDANGLEKPVTPENCPLYIEIQRHLANYSVEQKKREHTL
jgi:hypothetical protein